MVFYVPHVAGQSQQAISQFETRSAAIIKKGKKKEIDRAHHSAGEVCEGMVDIRWGGSSLGIIWLQEIQRCSVPFFSALIFFPQRGCFIYRCLDQSWPRSLVLLTTTPTLLQLPELPQTLPNAGGLCLAHSVCPRPLSAISASWPCHCLGRALQQTPNHQAWSLPEAPASSPLNRTGPHSSASAVNGKLPESFSGQERKRTAAD